MNLHHHLLLERLVDLGGFANEANKTFKHVTGRLQGVKL